MLHRMTAKLSTCISLKTGPSILGRASLPTVTTEDALLDSLSALSLSAGDPRSRNPSSSSSSTSDLLTQAGSKTPSNKSTSSSISTGNLLGSSFLHVPGSASRASALSSGASTAGSESSSQVLADFISESGSYSDPISSSLDRRAYKLAVWQAILVTVGLCESDEGTVMPGLKRPAHFPSPPLPLPTSLRACNKLIKQYIFLNIVNFKDSQLDAAQPLLLFPSSTQLTRYTINHRQFFKLARAKREFLQPLLRTFNYKK
ncbi:hypothetical protein P389DRAFT_31340 [Cystobasidium minutum MCA 4210]|uniref:uncharacterized protein n=1 Tax=Cystobasidium minutum MCA 4210 TaxID=1397322 RepID=UPI0034CEB4FE|eukprot:jgi/Rhomi1/31340/CE31339_739